MAGLGAVAKTAAKAVGSKGLGKSLGPAAALLISHADDIALVAKKVAPYAKQAAQSEAAHKTAATVKGAAVGAAGAVSAAALGAAHGTRTVAGAAARKVADTSREAAQAHREKADRRRASDEVRTARRVVLQTASVRTSAKEYCKIIESAPANAAVQALGGYNGLGCYAIAVYDGASLRTDVAAFRDVYVSWADDIGAALRLHFSGDGNPDVYADVKYRQNVQIFVYPYPESIAEEKCRALADALGAADSYNRREILPRQAF